MKLLVLLVATVLANLSSSKVCDKALDIGIIIDGSIGARPDSNNFKNFLQTLTTRFKVSREGTHFGVIVYSNKAKMEFKFARRRYHNSTVLSERIRKLTFPGGGRRTDRALQKASRRLFTPAGGDRPDKPNVLIVFTDGKNDKKKNRYSSVVPELKAKNVKVIAVGIGTEIPDTELNTIALDNPNNVIRIGDLNKIHKKMKALVKDTCNVNAMPNCGGEQQET